MKKLIYTQILTLLWITSSLSAKAGTFNEIARFEDKEPIELLHYQQRDYELVDPLGDYILAKTAPLIGELTLWERSAKHGDPTQLQDFLRRKAIADQNKIGLDAPGPDELNPHECQESAVANRHQVTDHRGNPIRVQRFLRKILRIIRSEAAHGITPKRGGRHEWSQEFLRNYGKKSKLPRKERLKTTLSKLLTSLAMGVSAQYLATGTEEALILDIRNRRLDSVTPEEMFRTSYQLNQGDIYKSILTIENILSRYWRDKNRQCRAVTRRLVEITLRSGRGDVYGAWYHFFGTMLYGYAYGGSKARWAAIGEMAADRFLNGFHPEKERQEDWINWDGANIGARLRRAIKRKPHFWLNN